MRHPSPSFALAPACMSQRQPVTAARKRPHRCSRCGREGHNVRRCPLPQRWYRQRCGTCGQVGHNARNCPKLADECRVCFGSQRLPCSKCNGSGHSVDAVPADQMPVAPRRTPPVARAVTLTDEQRRMAERVRARVRNAAMWNQITRAGDDELVGGESVSFASSSVASKYQPQDVLPSVENRCSRCMGLGYLSCMACSLSE